MNSNHPMEARLTKRVKPEPACSCLISVELGNDLTMRAGSPPGLEARYIDVPSLSDETAISAG
jgi:hypothetical protein